jgi:ankyrin repeat protein
VLAYLLQICAYELKVMWSALLVQDGWTAVMEASMVNDVEIVKLLVDAGADVHAQDEVGF